MPNRFQLRTKALDLLKEIVELTPNRSLGEIIHDVLQPKRRIEYLYTLEDEYLLEALDSYLSVVRIRAELADRAV
jgi:hypothetical protein